MKKNLLLILVVLIFSALLLSACGGGSTTDAPSVPAAYAGKTNPLGSDAANAGKSLYDVQCASCHGESGKGDGPAGQALTPPAADLVDSASKFADDYMHYRIAEGGTMAPYNSSMPPFKNTLSEDEIWQIVAYINTLK
ncbi:MAG TPA: cytochrome c [Anaerolineaceae bacterium]|nr:cytochrome c [Anaerolineaceae bacterium]